MTTGKKESKNAWGRALDTVKRYRSATIQGIRDQRKRLSRPSTYWDGKGWKRIEGTARYVRFDPGRSRGRAYAENVSKGELERREANWRKSKVGRAVLRRRREGRYPTVQSAEAIREAVEEKRRLRNMRRYVLGGMSRGFLYCPIHDAELKPTEAEPWICICAPKETATDGD